MTKEEIKTRWLEELRSGNHHQIQRTLKDQFGNGEYGYCCLGVLADKVMGLEVRIANDDGWTFVEIADYIEREWVV